MKLLDQMTHPDLYRVNVFRILEVPVDASSQEILERQQQVEIAIRLNLPIPRGDAPAMRLRATTPNQRRQAFRRVNDPEKRLIEELFWIWRPTELDPVVERAFHSLYNDDLDQAVGHFEQYVGAVDCFFSRHNLAILYHAWALDLIQDEVSFSSVQAMFRRALANWASALSSPAFWEYVRHRAILLDDPRLIRSGVRPLQEGIPKLLLRILAELARDACTRGRTGEAQGLIQLIRESPFPRPMVEAVLAAGATTTKERIYASVKDATEKGRDDPLLAAHEAERLIQQLEPMLSIVNAFLPAKALAAQLLGDHVAMALLDCQVAYAAKTDDWSRSVTLLNRAISFASTEDTQARLREELQIVQEHETRGGRWYGSGYWELAPALIERLERARKLMEAESFDEAIDILAELAMGRTRPGLRDDDQHLAVRPLSCVLNRRAIRRLNSVEFEYVPPVYQQAIEKAKAARKPRFGPAAETPPARKSSFVLPVSPLRCQACDLAVSEDYVRVPLRGISILVCAECTSRARVAEKAQEARNRRHVTEACKDLLFSRQINPKDTQSARWYDLLARMAQLHEVTLPATQDRQHELGMVTLSELIRRQPDRLERVDSTWLTGVARHQVEAVAKLLDEPSPVRGRALGLLQRMGAAATPALPYLRAAAAGAASQEEAQQVTDLIARLDA